LLGLFKPVGQARRQPSAKPAVLSAEGESKVHAVGRKGPGALHIAAASAHRDDATCLACLPAFFPHGDKPKKVEDHHHIHIMAAIMQGDLDRTGTLLHGARG